MNLLLDTHALLWWASDNRALGRRARQAISSGQNSIWVSAASIWEMSIKAALSRLDLAGVHPERIAEDLEQRGFESLPITVHHAVAVRDLPAYHRDPFDRMLIAQAQLENLVLVTADPAIMAYDVRVLSASK